VSQAATARATGVVLTAATRWEAGALRAALRGGAVVLRTGVGPRCAAQALSRIDTEACPPALIVSAGFAGALQADLDSGDVVAEQLTPCPQAAKALESAAVSVRRVVRFGRIQHSDSVLAEPRQKLECGRATGALAVDMESAAVRAWAQAHGLPALALRVVFDEAACALPRGLPAGDSPLRLGLYAAAHPFAWPRLLALWPRQQRAAAALTAIMRAFLEAL
jgi:nucleoside phosphorylase